MFTLPILPDELRIPLDRLTTTVEIPNGEAGTLSKTIVVGEFPGCVAVARPLGLEEQSKWHDAFPGQDHQSQAATALVFQQLLRIEGLAMKSSSGAEAFDPANPAHRRSLPMAIRSEVYNKLFERGSVGEELEKNSDSPSASDGTRSGAEPSADGVASGNATR